MPLPRPTSTSKFIRSTVPKKFITFIKFIKFIKFKLIASFSLVDATQA
jgi:hypothetical protein